MNGPLQEPLEANREATNQPNTTTTAGENDNVTSDICYLKEELILEEVS